MKIKSALSVIVIAVLSIAAVAAARTVMIPHAKTDSDLPNSVQAIPNATGVAAEAPSAVAAEPCESAETLISQAAVTCQCAEAVAQLSKLVDAQQLALSQLEQTSGELIAAYERGQADLQPAPPTQSWHGKMIANNGPAYTTVVEILSSLTEEEFPTQITWYGKNWRALTLPYRVGRYPTAAERDDLLILLEEVGEFGVNHQRLMKQLRALEYND